jgi:hypothetical protein
MPDNETKFEQLIEDFKNNISIDDIIKKYIVLNPEYDVIVLSRVGKELVITFIKQYIIYKSNLLKYNSIINDEHNSYCSDFMLEVKQEYSKINQDIIDIKKSIIISFGWTTE